MSERTAPALARIDELLATLERLPRTDRVEHVMDDVKALRRAVDAFHMEGIRFRMYNVDRDLKDGLDTSETRRLYEAVRELLEAAGFHTRSHSAP